MTRRSFYCFYCCLLTVCITFLAINAIKFYTPILAERMREDFMLEVIRAGGRPQMQAPAPGTLEKILYSGSPGTPFPHPTPDSNEPPL